MRGPVRRILLEYSHWIILALIALLPIADLALPREYRIADLMRPILIFAILGIGLNIITGYTGLLNLGVAAFMAIGAYTFAILTTDIFPFQIGVWFALGGAFLMGAVMGAILGLPTIRLRGDYLAIVTLGFGEIIQDTFKNLESITKGTQSINPLPFPTLFGYEFQTDKQLPWFYLFLAILTLLVLLNQNVVNSRIGRSWLAIREDELAAQCSGINPIRAKLLAFSIGAAVCSIAGALWAMNLGSSGEPGNYDLNISVIALCTVIVGGMGNVGGVLLGAILMIGFNSILLTKLTAFLVEQGISSTTNVYTTPTNWKYMAFGMALILTMRFLPQGLLPARQATRRAARKTFPKSAEAGGA